MLKYGNKEFRNLQEQVLANMRNIEDIIKGQPIMATYTLHIVGSLESESDLPDPLSYEGEYGDAYIVGTTSPFDVYIFGKEYENEDAPSWIGLGPVWVEGPQGETGPQGPQGIQGLKGDKGDSATITVGTTTTGAAGSDASVTNSGTASAAVLNFTIPQGIQGEKGDKGDTGLGVPEIQSGDAGKALMVNAGETDAEWTTLPSGLPDIESGDAGKLLAVNSNEDDAEWVTDNSLKLPASAPASQQLVGVNTSGAQNALGIGSGLVVDSNVLKNNSIAYLDFNQGLTISISDELYSEIFNNGKTLFIPYNLSSTTCAGAENVIFYTNISKLVSVPRIYGSGSKNDSNGYYTLSNYYSYQMTLGGTAGNHTLTIASNTTTVTSIVNNQTAKYSQLLSTLTGSVGTWPATPSINQLMNLYKFAYQESSTLMVFFDMKYFDNSTKTFYGEAESATYKYTLTITTNTRGYVITQTAK